MKGDSDAPADADAGDTAAGESRDVYQTIFEEMSDAAFLIDVDRSGQDYTFTYLRNNASRQQQTGLSEDELRGQRPRELLDDEQGLVVAENYRRCVEQKETLRYEETLQLPGGTSHWQTRLTPIVTAGEVTQIVGVARDITDKKEQEQQLERINRRFETIMETMSAAVFLKDADGQYLMMNQACRELFNAEDRDIVGLTDAELFPPDTAEQAKTDDQQVIETGETIEVEETIPTAAGNTVRLTRKSPVYDERGDVVGLCGVSTDITDRKQYREALDSLLDATRQMVSASTTEEVAEVVTTTVKESIGLAMNGVHLYDETAGGLAPVSVSQGSRQVVEEPPVLDEGVGWQAYETGEPQVYHDLQAADTVYNDQTDIQSEIAFPLGDHGVLLISSTETDSFTDSDITLANTLAVNATAALSQIETYQQLQAHEQTVAEQRDNLRIVNKIVRHDIRNDLQLIAAYAKRAEDRVDEAKELHKISQRVTNAVELTKTAREVTDILLQADQTDEGVVLSAVLSPQIENIDSSYPRSTIKIIGQVPDIAVVGSDMLESVFRNLLSNAIQHNDKAAPEVSVSVSETDSSAVVEVADNGPGIPDRHKTSMFEEGNSGLDSDGTGLGLYLVKKIVERNNGRIEVVDNEPDGTVFILKLPKMQSR
ncbi:sensor histidine kinase [Halonotius pteroides]|uniref:histidine kinase n=1 Tax=Halonotius pteroides TaxID=268735 RepID=A0A3A6Q2D1_9EURY|nr:PAS domain-containing protein [Halonotius pteroides]RJX51091.1 hypothetical protein DP106_03125 [Halonotius pteroides]